MKNIDRHLKYIENDEKKTNILKTLKHMKNNDKHLKHIEEHEKYWQTSLNTLKTWTIITNILKTLKTMKHNDKHLKNIESNET